MIGITSYGAYIPRLRLDRMAIVRAMGWFAPAVMTVAQGERSMCNWDEDALTMAVAASRDCLTGRDKQALDAVYLASTTLPFADRQNAGILSAALNLSGERLTADFTASQRASTNGLLAALESIRSGDRKEILVAASDRRETQTAYFYEMWFGDGAAALTVGNRDVIAEYRGSYSVSYDFTDHYRGAQKRFDYMWEERWLRDAGYSRIIPEAVNGLLERQGLAPDQVAQFIYPCFFKAEHKKIAKKLGLAPEQVADNLHEVCGETGTAHPFLMLTRILETARPGDRIVVAGFGQGCNALLFEVTEAIQNLPPRRGFTGHLEDKKTTDNYPKWLKFRDLIDTEMGIRAEAPSQTAMTVLWRKNPMIMGLVGGKCEACGTLQFPKSEVCVNPECGALHSQEDYEFADRPATVKTYTGDMLAVSVDPPAVYGMVQFEDGGRFMADFTDCELEEVRVGLPVRMEFKRKAADPDRGNVNYFWKAVPDRSRAEAMNRIRFDGQVAVITGAGGGLGRIYALELAERGAKVVVNDYGGARDGAGGGSTSPADKVVEEIRTFGGEAVANHDNVATSEGGERIVQTALEAFGRIDILINNAGILRDKSFLKMEPGNWAAVLAVHLDGAYHVTRPAFSVMKRQGYGRIIMTTSAAGLYGNFGQTHYSAAKMGLVGLMNALKLEGEKYDIKVNTVAPLAASRLTEDVMPPDLFEKMRPEYVAPLVLYLAAEECRENGEIFNAGMGYCNRAAVLTGSTVRLGDAADPPTPEDIQDHWDRINDLSDAVPYQDLNTALGAFLTPPAREKAADTADSETGLDIGAVFDRMEDSFNPDAAEGVDVVFQFHISGDSGGDWYCIIRDRACTIEPGVHESPACTLKMKDADFADMMSGRLPPMAAFTSGKLRIEGDVMKSQLIEKLFTIG